MIGRGGGGMASKDQEFTVLRTAAKIDPVTLFKIRSRYSSWQKLLAWVCITEPDGSPSFHPPLNLDALGTSRPRHRQGA